MHYLACYIVPILDVYYQLVVSTNKLHGEQDAFIRVQDISASLLRLSHVTCPMCSQSCIFVLWIIHMQNQILFKGPTNIRLLTRRFLFHGLLKIQVLIGIACSVHITVHGVHKKGFTLVY